MKLNNLSLHYIVWLFIFLFPALKWVQGGVGTAQKALHLAFFLLFTFFILVKRVSYPNRKIIYFLLVYLLVIVPYYIITTLVFTSNLGWTDVTDFTRPFVYLLYLFFPLLYPVNNEQLKSLMKFFIWVCVIQIAFSLLVYYPPLWSIVDLYKGRMSDDFVLFHFFRWSGTFGYPSDFAFYLSFFIYYQYVKLVDAKENFQKKDWGLVILLFIALFLTLSRGGIGTVIIMLGFAYLLGRGKKSKAVNAILTTIVVSVLFVVTSLSITYENNNMLKLDYLESMFEGDDMDDSTKHRVVEMELATEYFAKCFPFGCGTNRVALTKRVDVIESFYGYHMAKWGAIGILLYFIFLLWIINMLWASAKMYTRGSFESTFSYATLFLVLSIPVVFGFSSAMSDRFKALPLHYLLVGYVIQLYVVKKKQKGNMKEINAEGKC